MTANTPNQDLPATEGTKGRDNAAEKQAERDARQDERRLTQAERIAKAKKDAGSGDHGDNPIVDVHGLPLPGDPQLLPGEVQTVGGPVTDDGGRVEQVDTPTADNGGRVEQVDTPTADNQK
jgi:hypothetical protein